MTAPAPCGLACWPHFFSWPLSSPLSLRLGRFLWQILWPDSSNALTRHQKSQRQLLKNEQYLCHADSFLQHLETFPPKMANRILSQNIAPPLSQQQSDAPDSSGSWSANLIWCRAHLVLFPGRFQNLVTSGFFSQKLFCQFCVLRLGFLLHLHCGGWCLATGDATGDVAAIGSACSSGSATSAAAAVLGLPARFWPPKWRKHTSAEEPNKKGGDLGMRVIVSCPFLSICWCFSFFSKTWTIFSRISSFPPSGLELDLEHLLAFHSSSRLKMCDAIGAWEIDSELGVLEIFQKF